MSSFMITFNWGLWFANEFLMMIILLNFLIAIISQSYDKVISKSTILLYESKCDFIAETSVLIDSFPGVFGKDFRSQIFILQASTEDEGQTGDDVAGFVKTITKVIKSEIKEVKKSQTSLQKKLENYQ